MDIDSATWSQVTTLFDELMDLSSEERRRHLDDTAPPPDVRRYIERLLAAHDTPDKLLVDQPVDDIVSQMLGESGAGSSVIPGDLSGRRFGNWEAGEELGRGGMSVILRGWRADGRFEKDVAIKLLPPGPVGPARQERLLREIRLLARLDHPGIARLLDGGLSDDGLPYLVMEQIDGVPITRYCEEQRLDVQQRVALFLQVAEAVAYSHRHLLVHCDIKPSNVLVDRDGHVKLLDFGIAAMLSDDEGSRSASPELRCSPAYAAPEQLRGETPAVAQDIFSLGALLYELISGERIRDLRQATSVLFGKPVPDDIPPPSEQNGPIPAARLKGDLDAICMQALSPDPEQRYSVVASLMGELRRWQTGLPVRARQGGRLYVLGKWFRRHRLAALTAAMVVGSLVLGTGVALWQARLAAIETERAEAALLETEAALQRSEAMQEFLINLFRAAEPDRPRDQLPDTEELVALGARRAMDEGLAPPSERFGMLFAISQVYLGQHRLGDAQPLLEAAEALARDQEQLRPRDLARILRLQASAATMARDLDHAEAILMEAEALTVGRNDLWSEFADARATRGWVVYMRGDHQLALDLVEPLYQQLAWRDDVRDRVRYRILNLTAAAYVSQGRLEEASELRREVTELIKAIEGPESRTYGIDLVNLGVLEMRRGDFEKADALFGQAIALYDRIFENPVELRAAARANRATLSMNLGDYQTAFDRLERASEEWSQTQGRDMGDYEYYFHQRGKLHALMGHWEEAESDLDRAMRLFEAQDQANPGGVRVNRMVLAEVQCRRGQAEAGRQWLESVEGELDGRQPRTVSHRIHLQQAQAACSLAQDRPEAALEHLALASGERDTPGYLVERAGRMLMEAKALHQLDRRDEALDRLEETDQLFLGTELPDHPFRDEIARVKAHLAH